MQYCRFQTEGGPQYGAVELRHGELWMVGEMGSPADSDRAGRGSSGFQPVPISNLKLLAPITPSKIVCIGRNYREHAAELGNEVPKEPLMFLKPPSAIIGPGAAISIPVISKRVDYEGELGVVIARTCRKLSEKDDVRPYIQGYVAVNDVTARDLQRSDGQWSRAKGFDTFCPVGPFVSNEIDPNSGLTVTTRLNGVVKQHGSTRDLIFDIATLLRSISAVMTLYPGDLIATGTPAGVGPMQAGDEVAVEIEGLGILNNPVAAEKD